MSEIITTITLQIGDLDEKKSVYPLRLFLDDKDNPEAETVIPKEEFDRNPDANKWEFDPVKKFLEEPDATSDFKKIGKKLYSLIHRDQVGTEWDKFKAKKHRVQLDIKPKDIAPFPWELAYHENIDWLSINKEQTFFRYYEQLPEMPVTEFPNDSLPLRVLIVIGSQDDDEAVLPLDEVRQIEAEIYDYDRTHPENKLVHRMIDFEILSRPDLQTLEDRYKEIQPHIFHFIGHGGFNRDDEAYLNINYYNEKGELDEIEWTHDLIYAKFRAWKWIPRFVFINACRSEVEALSDEKIQEQAWSIGGVFRRLGVPAVLTMQADIDGKSAGVFGAAIYKSLAKLELLDEAVGDARNTMLNLTKTLKKRDWATPVLTVAVPPEEILPFKVPASNLAKIKECVAFKDIESFSDRAAPRRNLYRGFYPLPPAIADKNLIIVHGKKDAGKTWLVKWFLEVCALLGNDVRYVEVSGGDKGKRWLDVLLQIRHGDKIKQHSSLIYEPLNETAFHKFYWELENRFKGSEPPVLEGQKVTVKDDYKMAAAEWTPNFYTDTIPSFRQALIQSAEINKPLIIVLDHFEDILEDDMKKDLIPELIRPAAKGELKQTVGEGQVRSVKLILVLTEEQFKNFEIETLIGGFYPVPVNFLSKDTFFDVASEYLRKVSKIGKLGYSDDRLENAAKALAELTMNDYPPTRLELLKHFLS